MKYDKNVVHDYERIHSEGKLLEVIPLLEQGDGSPLMLPPSVWRVPNEFLGYREFHFLRYPLNFVIHDRIIIPGTNAAQSVRLTFLVRLLEDSPDSNPAVVATVDAEAVRGLIEAIKVADRRGTDA